MPRIPETELEQLKSEVSVQRLIEAAGVVLKKAGKDLLGRCPFHEDDSASLVVTPAKNLWHCFGCGAAGGPIDWIIKTRGVSFRHAVELLREGVPTSSSAAGLVVGSPAETAAPIKRTTVRALPPPVAFDADDAQLLAQVADYYAATLKQSPEALAYLESRGLSGSTAAEAIEVFKLGYANRTLGLRLPEKTRKAGADIRTRLERLGVYRDSGHEHLNGSLVIPLFDGNGSNGHQVVNLYGRKIRNDLRAGTPAHLYLPGSPRRGVFNRAALIPKDMPAMGVGACEELIVCEALIDALTFWCAGLRNVTSAYGIEGVTDELIEAIQSSGVARVLIAFDRDEAGERGAAKLAERLMAIGIDCFRVVFPKGMDANEYAMKVTPASKSLGLLIRKAQWMGKGAAPKREHAEPVELPSSAADASPLTTPAAEQKAPALPTTALPAAAMPSAPAADAPAQVSEREVVLVFGETKHARRWRVRGLPKNLAVGVLKVNVMVSAEDGRFHVDTLDLYAARARAVFVQQAVSELGANEGVLKTDLGRVLLKLEALQDEAIREALTPKTPSVPSMTEADHADALALLKSPDLLRRIVDDFEACGVVGERTNKLVGYLAAVSRLLERPLAIVIQSSSAAGKSSLMDAVLAFVPEEARTKYSAMTGQSLFYMGQTSLKHRILAIAEEEGASRASYAMKLLQSEGELTIASTGTDPVSGNLITQEYRVEGPTMLMMTTTAIDLDEELLNRCLVLTVDEDREQTRRIHALQRNKRTLAGLTQRESKTTVLTLHQNAQRLLRAVPVVNPYADQLTFLDDRTRTRRDHDKYLTLIDTIALLHQHQREVKTAHVHGRAVAYIEATLDDIATANQIAHEVLGRSLDELPPQTRRVLVAIVDHVREQMHQRAVPRAEARFTRKQLREATGCADTQLRVHLERLVALEYLIGRSAGAGGRFTYELLFDGDAGAAVHLSGLIDVASLRRAGEHATATAKSRGEELEVAGRIDEIAGRLRGESVPVAARSRDAASPAKPALVRLAANPNADDSKTSISSAAARDTPPVVSYAHEAAKAVASLAAAVGVEIAAEIDA
jgi:DNA primase